MSAKSLRGAGVTAETASFVKLALSFGYLQHIIAAYLHDNQGRVSETKNGKKFADAPMADQLPPDFPMVA
jgi:hypothetical protein